MRVLDQNYAPGQGMWHRNAPLVVIHSYWEIHTTKYTLLYAIGRLSSISCSHWGMFILGLVAKVHESELTSLYVWIHIWHLGTLPTLIGPNQYLKNYVPSSPGNWKYICFLSYGGTLSLLFTLGIISGSHHQIWFGTGDLQRLDMNYLSTPTWTLRRWGDTWGICTTSMRTGPLYEGTVFPC